MAKLYSRINWVDYPSTTTPMNATNMNKMDKGLDDVDTRVDSLNATKANKTQPVWIDAPLIAPVVNYGNLYQTCQYMKDEFGIVHIRGVIKGGINNATVFVLPVGYRPRYNEIFTATQNNSFGMCTIFQNGNVLQSGTGVGTSFCFGDVSFVTV